jgi:hypothetical protein
MHLLFGQSVSFAAFVTDTVKMALFLTISYADSANPLTSFIVPPATTTYYILVKRIWLRRCGYLTATVHPLPAVQITRRFHRYMRGKSATLTTNGTGAAPLL